jgi:hypothetical protein
VGIRCDAPGRCCALAIVARPRYCFTSPWYQFPFVYKVRARPGRLSALSIFHSKSVLYGAFMWACSALNVLKPWFPARAARGDRPRLRAVRRVHGALLSSPAGRTAAAFYHHDSRAIIIAKGVLRLRQGPCARYYTLPYCTLSLSLYGEPYYVRVLWLRQGPRAGLPRHEDQGRLRHPRLPRGVRPTVHPLRLPARRALTLSLSVSLSFSFSILFLSLSAARRGTT